jgi:hypothetical protein
MSFVRATRCGAAPKEPQRAHRRNARARTARGGENARARVVYGDEGAAGCDDRLVAGLVRKGYARSRVNRTEELAPRQERLVR